jgi:hypothetical protein
MGEEVAKVGSNILNGNGEPGSIIPAAVGDGESTLYDVIVSREGQTNCE